MFCHVKATNLIEGNLSDFVLQIRILMRRAHEVARKQWDSYERRSKEVYNARLFLHKYMLGNVVWLLHETPTVAVNAKFETVLVVRFCRKLKYLQ